jgi:hypothetical protein
MLGYPELVAKSSEPPSGSECADALPEVASVFRALQVGAGVTAPASEGDTKPTSRHAAAMLAVALKRRNPELVRYFMVRDPFRRPGRHRRQVTRISRAERLLYV